MPNWVNGFAFPLAQYPITCIVSEFLKFLFIEALGNQEIHVIVGFLTIGDSIMPAMPRPKTKATKIAYKLLGKPANIAFKRNKKQQELNERLIFEDTVRVRQEKL